jgi:hypothetical protein
MYQNQPATVEVEVPHSMIRRMDASTGIVTVVAGTGNETTYTMGYNVSSVGIPGYTGDHGLATAAEVNASALAFDSKGNLYFIQDGAYVRKIDLSTGIVTTVTGAAGTPSATNNQCAPVSPEGGSALTAQYTLLSGITFDAADNMYLADSNQCVVRRIDAATQTVHTVAGAPNAGVPYLNLGYGDFGQPISDGSALEAQLSIPSQVQLDSNANIYIASNYNGGVRKVDVSQSILPFAGPYLQQTYLQPTLTVSAPLTATVLNAGNSGTLQFASPFISPSWGINYNTFLRDVTDPTGTADCYDLESVAPGNECPISADFAPQYSSIPNVVTAQIGVNDNAPNTPQTIQLTGISFGDPPAVTLTPALVSLFTPQGSSSAPQQLTLINNGTSPLPISAIAITGSGASAYSITSNTCGTELAAVSACYIYVKFSPPYLGTTTPPDNLKATLSVTDIAVNSPQISQLVGLGTAAVPIPLHIVETIDVSDAPTLSLASQLAILETIDVSDAAPSLSVAAQLNINEAIGVSDAPIAVPQLTATTATIMVSSTAIPLGGAENITIQVTPTAATGTVNLYDGSALLGTGALLNGHFTYDTGNLTAGTHSLHASYLGSSTYAASSTGTALVQVQATLTITANNASRAFAAANPTLGYTVTGYTNGDTSAVLSGAPTLSTTAVTHSPAGSYPITVAPGTLTAPSYYNLSFVPGTLTITGNHSQTIYFLPFPTAISLSVKTLTLAATTSSALPITYQVSGPATLSGTNLTLTGPGTVTVTATQPGSPTFSPATSVAQTFIVVTP